MYKYLYDTTLKNRMSSISSNLHEGNRPVTFHVSQCWIILKKNPLQWLKLKSGDLFFLEEAFIRSKSQRWLEKKKWRRRKREKN